MKLFVDHCICLFIARAMNAVVAPDGHEVVALSDKFPADIDDVGWMTALGDEGGWVVLSDDHRIRKIPAEKAAWRAAKLKGFFLAPGWRKMTTVQKAGLLLLRWPQLVETERNVGVGMMLEIPAGKSSRLRQL